MMGPDTAEAVAEVEDAEGLVQFATGVRNRLVLAGWSTGGAESLVETIVSHTLGQRFTTDMMGLDDDDDEGPEEVEAGA